MSLDVFQSCVNGYTDRMFDLQTLSVQQGFWAGYYSNGKHPKPYDQIIKTMVRNRSKGQHHGSSVQAPDVDVEAFKRTEQQFWEKMNQ